MKTADLVHPFRIRDGKGFRFKDFDPGDTLGFKSEYKKHAQEHLQKGVARLAELQDKEGRNDQARDVGRESAGMRSIGLQGAVGGRTGP
jgi:hypothetical protein